jgi:hypothetical protein
METGFARATRDGSPSRMSKLLESTMPNFIIVWGTAEAKKRKERQIETGNKQQDPITDTRHDDDELKPVSTTPKIEELMNFFHCLLRLLCTLNPSIEELSPDTQRALAAEIDSDRTMEARDGMNRAIITNCELPSDVW